MLAEAPGLLKALLIAAHRGSRRATHHATRHGRGALVVAAAFAAWLAPREAHACGVSSGAGDGVASCSLDVHEKSAGEHPAEPWRLGVVYTYTSTALHFTSDHHADEERTTFLVTLEYRVLRRLSLLAGFGALSGGQIVTRPTTELVTYDMETGPLFALGASYRILDPARSGEPFLLFGGQLSYVASGTRPALTSVGATGYYAADLRLGMTLGITLFDRVSPYVSTRAFGGPVYWRIAGQHVQGTDVHKYQVGAGLALALGGKRGPHLDAFMEGVPLGEQALTGGFGVSY